MTARLERQIAGLFDGAVAVAVLPVTAAHPPLWPEEEAAMARAVARRRAEFTAGRAAARLAMQGLGLPPQAVPMAPDRSPVWPSGVTGSISHAAGICAAVLSRDVTRLLGLDIEDAAPLDPALWPLVLTPEEITALAQTPADQRGTCAKRIFGIKEAAYKAQFPLTGAVIGFQALEVLLNADPQSNHARVRASKMGTMQPGLGELFPESGASCRLAHADTDGTRILIAAIALPA
jgi:4'-phosphopantetheinyl transferase EntD